MCGDQQAALVLGAKIVKVEQGELRGPICIVDRDLPWHLLEKAGQHRLGQGLSSDNDGRGALSPEMNEMRFAATVRTMYHQPCRRPVRPAIDPLDGRDVALRNHKIRSPESGTAGQVESELDHLKRIIGQAG